MEGSVVNFIKIAEWVSLGIVLLIGIGGLVYAASIVWINAIDKLADAMTVNKLFRQFLWENKHLFQKKRRDAE